MKINTKATGITLTPSIVDYIEKRVKTFEKFLAGVEDILVNVEVGKTTKHHKSGDVFRAEVQVVANGKTYYAVAETEDLYAAIDEVKDQVTRELTSKRKKTSDLFRRGGAKVKDLLRGFIPKKFRN